MTWLRILWKLPALTLVTVVIYVVIMTSASVLGLIRGGGWDGFQTARWRSRCFRWWSRRCCGILGISTTVEGAPPDGSFFLVANHLGYVDVIVLASQSLCVFVARGDVAGWPIFGTLCRLADTLFIDRGNKRDIPRVVAEIERVLEDGRGIAVFPEGTSSRGAEVRPFRSSLLEAAATAGIPVSYAALSYRTPVGSRPAHLAVCWWGDMPFARHLLDLMGLPGVDATLRYGDEPIRERDRKQLARRLHGAVEQRFQPVV